jgi:hypothetical protein
VSFLRDENESYGFSRRGFGQRGTTISQAAGTAATERGSSLIPGRDATSTAVNAGSFAKKPGGLMNSESFKQAAGFAASGIGGALGAMGGGAAAMGAAAAMGMATGGIGLVAVGLIQGVLGLNKKKKPYGSFRSTGNHANGFEDGFYRASRLGNIGFDDAGSGNKFKASEGAEFADAAVQLDNAIADYIGDEGIAAVRGFFDTNPMIGGKNDLEPMAYLKNRYARILGAAAPVSEKAANAQKLLAFADEQVNLVTSIAKGSEKLSGISADIKQKEADAKAARSARSYRLGDERGDFDPDAGQQGSPMKFLAKGGDDGLNDIDLTAEYQEYVKQGGAFNYDQFQRYAVRAARGKDYDAARKATRDKLLGTDSDTFKPGPAGLDLKATLGSKVSRKASGINLADEDFLGLMFAGLEGLTADQVFGATKETKGNVPKSETSTKQNRASAFLGSYRKGFQRG